MSQFIENDDEEVDTEHEKRKRRVRSIVIVKSGSLGTLKPRLVTRGKCV